MATVESQPIPPPPVTVDITVRDKDGTFIRFSPVWMQWFNTLAVKAVGLNADIIAIAALSGQGFLTRMGSGSWAVRTHTGTPDRITVSNGTGFAGNPTYDIAATYVGQTSITTLGTIGTGVWNGTTIAIANGGTGATTAAGARTNLGASTVGANVFTVGNPSAITFLRVNVDNTVDLLNASDFRTAIGAGTGNGTVTSVDLANSTGLTASGGPIIGAGSLTYTLSANLQAWHAIATSTKTDSAIVPSTVPASGQLLVGNAGGTAYAPVSVSGDITIVSTGAVTIANDSVTYAKMQNVSDTDKLLGRSTAGAGNVEEITCTAAGRALLDDVSASAQRTTLETYSGTYAPTVTPGSNCSAASALANLKYSRIGVIVHVSGVLSITPTATGASVSCTITLPIASNFVATTDAHGVLCAVYSGSLTREVGFISGTTSDLLQTNFIPLSTSAHTTRFEATYEIL